MELEHLSPYFHDSSLGSIIYKEKRLRLTFRTLYMNEPQSDEEERFIDASLELINIVRFSIDDIVINDDYIFLETEYTESLGVLHMNLLSPNSLEIVCLLSFDDPPGGVRIFRVEYETAIVTEIREYNLIEDAEKMRGKFY